ncbi:bifunctional diaminohydroxyphosphoribosylaminopyrimidine deaminase/5-amino-6-(5-phosphoribosylamino)uracil reductase RibD [Falsirhodobacter sp. 20TX0035]|nr:bifunctional diaminohydroxyphosphoribosylaminopyrimidine deaminase/5-amino-6-(5-phosphoribosylamino)uracil reductase RibD [Falsirhodobacter sp. 20TX0035]MDB6454235.1 bifunctional diaminohydroxyphosphoribosylaminopyrimidine deaminase/5-amino-6-(5-phosphoribosylamino)uracil reductase RibD [Falsirhodobacter sp. 20TX0035]
MIWRALRLARSRKGMVWPNPPVGAVLVRDRTVIATGTTQDGGRPHAERVALLVAGEQARGATMYVTLEPCCHWGRTPPCADAIIEAGVTRVVAAMQDPDPRVNGGGFRRLRDAGLAVTVGIGGREASRIMSGFLHRVETGKPRLRLLDDPSSGVPAGADALLETRDGAPVLLLRDGPEAIPDHPEILRALGDLGLTTVAVWRNDPLAALLHFPQGTAT